ncbi:hypothetical protein L596_011301 [Steinernema carpocapsae]|uniref:Uncharacterized protein n=1 Tax=Steinernema carpocapsae TaxID=34508 RepID=A0A4U5NUF0_STECR|nr:hypothetical protein L596_011301 [Steinernema carpocapsae]
MNKSTAEVGDPGFSKRRIVAERIPPPKQFSPQGRLWAFSLAPAKNYGVFAVELVFSLEICPWNSLTHRSSFALHKN